MTWPCRRPAELPSRGSPGGGEAARRGRGRPGGGRGPNGSLNGCKQSSHGGKGKRGPLIAAPVVAYAQENGKDKALDEFSNKTGSFVRGDLYIYAYDFNGTCLAHPFKPDWIGKNKLDVTDSNGVPSLRNTLNVAKEGKGFTYFIFPNPAHGNRDEFKIAYAMKVDDNWFLGSGIYISCS